MLTPHAGLRKDPTAQAQGRKAVKNGRTFEALLSQTHATYRTRGHGVVSKLHPETAGPINARRIIGPGDVDCLGFLHWEGVTVPVAFDAKSTAGCATWTLDSRPKARAVELRQLRYLHDFQLAGGFAFLLIYDRDAEAAFVVTCDGIRTLHDTGAIPLRAKQRGGGISTPWMTVPLASVADIARGAPPLDYRAAVAGSVASLWKAP